MLGFTRFTRKDEEPAKEPAKEEYRPGTRWPHLTREEVNLLLDVGDMVERKRTKND